MLDLRFSPAAMMKIQVFLGAKPCRLLNKIHMFFSCSPSYLRNFWQLFWTAF